MYQRIGPAAYKNNLDNAHRLDELYGFPHRQFKTVHIAGTNGKGSVSHMLAAILQKAGYKTGLYTSPHLKDFRERIRINGKPISKISVARWVEEIIRLNVLEDIDPSFFELTVAMAFDYFARHNVDIAIIETGLGGRLDSTNIITPEVSIITSIGLDHTDLLGNTIESIAFEKAGIIKQGVPVVVGSNNDKLKKVFIDESTKKGSGLYFADNEYVVNYALTDLNGCQVVSINKNGQLVFPGLRLDLRGCYQHKNLPAVLKAIDILKVKGWKIKDINIYDGLCRVMEITGLQGRWQIIGHNPLVICDTAHNADAIAEVTKQIKKIAYKKLHIVFGIVSDKDPLKILELLPRDATYYFARAKIPRAMDEKELSGIAHQFCLKGKSYSSVTEAYDAAKDSAAKEDFIFVGGSSFVVAEIL